MSGGTWITVLSEAFAFGDRNFTAVICPDSLCMCPPAHSQTTGFSLLSQMGQATRSPEAVLNCVSNQGKPKSTFILIVCEIRSLLNVTHAHEGLRIL